MWEDGETFLSLYQDMKEFKKYAQKPPNAVCMWCSEHYVSKDRYCYSYGKNVNDPLTPRRCGRYTGETVTEENLKSVYELLNAGNRLI